MTVPARITALAAVLSLLTFAFPSAQSSTTVSGARGEEADDAAVATAARLTAHVAFLADDVLEGRAAGTRGHEIQDAVSVAARPPIVTPAAAPVGGDGQPVQWVTVAAPHVGTMLAAIARPSGSGPFPAVLVLHGTHGFAPEYVEWASALAHNGFVAVAGCWFSGGGGAGATKVATPLPCPAVPPLGPGEYPQGVRFVDALVRATRALPDVRPDRFALVGHSRGAGVTQQYILAGGDVQAAVLHSSGYALAPWDRAAAFTMPLLIMHGTADGPADGGGINTRFELAQRFVASLHAQGRTVETAFCEGCGHSTFFTSPTQRRQELNHMIQFLRGRLGR